MEDQILIKQNINQHLRYGDLSKIKRAVLLNKKKDISISQIRNILNEKIDRWDDDVIEEAQVLIIKSQKALLKAKQRLI